MICTNCKKEIVGAAVLSPNLDETKREMCIDCARNYFAEVRK